MREIENKKKEIYMVLQEQRRFSCMDFLKGGALSIDRLIEEERAPPVVTIY